MKINFIDIFFYSPLGDGGMMISEAIILAGGLGTRLKTAVPDVPKCMAPVNGKPFIAFVIEHLQSQGIEQFIFALGYKHEIFKSFLATKLTSNNYLLSVEPEPFGTGGAIKFACLKTTGKNVLIVNGDTLFKADITKLAPFHAMCGADCTLSLKPMQNFSRYGIVELNKDYSINSFKEKQYYKQGLINAGLYVLNTSKFLKEDLPDNCSFEKDYLEKYYKERRMYGVIQNEYFIDIGVPGDYEKAKLELK